MTADEIRGLLKFYESTNAATALDLWLCEIAAQLAEMNERENKKYPSFKPKDSKRTSDV